MPAATIERCYRRLGKAIEARRVALSLSQRDLARRVGVSRSNVSDIELGRHRIALHAVKAFARALRLTAAQLLEGAL